MMIRMNYILVFFLLFFVSVSFAQQSELYEEDVPLIYKNEASGGVTIHSNGWGLNFRRGTHITGYKKKMYEFEAVTMHHPKEFKTSYYENGNEYVYGKLNQLLILRTGIGIQKVIYGKGDRSGVEVRYNCVAGLSTGITKPVYLVVSVPKVGGANQEREPLIKKYDPATDFPDNIIGQADFGNGMYELKLHPGLYGKFGFSFEYGSSDTDIKSIETGMVVDAFPSVIPIMALNENQQVYFSFYVTIFPIGGKW